MGARRMRADRLVSVPAVVRSPIATDVDETTLLEATESGWLFSCRVGPRERLVSLFTDSDLLPSSRAGRKARLQEVVDQSLHLSVLLEDHAYTCLEAESVVPAHGSLLNPIAGDGWLAAGEAALCHDPLCGDGLVGAMNSGRYAALALVAAADGDKSALVDYAHRVKERFRYYQITLLSYYSMEQRWHAEEFWARRSSYRRAHYE
jgi:2-polyprenyl-6-methoxyphenol hydroxylase-like FAD-dependent oxidoreductase